MGAVAVSPLPLGEVQVVKPFPGHDLVLGRIGVRSASFGVPPGEKGIVTGSALGPEPGPVVVRARGELVERVSNILAGREAESAAELVATFDELRRRGVVALDPAAWVEVASATERRHATMLWVPGRSLVDDREVFVPASAVFLRHCPPAGCHLMLRAGSTGVAAHVTRADAVDHALLEVLERDLIWRSWHADAAAPETVAFPSVPDELRRLVHDLQLHLTVLVVPGPGGTGCVVACLHTPDRRQQTFGARCVRAIRGPGLTIGTEAAVYEALMVRWSMGTSQVARAREVLADRPVEWPRSALEHALWAFDFQDSLGYWLDRPGRGGQPSGLVDAADVVDRSEMAALVAGHAGEDVVAVDTSAAAVCPEGVVVVRVVAPGAHRLLVDDRTVGAAGSSNRAVSRPHPFG